MSSVANARAEADLSAILPPPPEAPPRGVPAAEIATTPSRTLADRWPSGESGGEPIKLSSAIDRPSPPPVEEKIVKDDDDDPLWLLLIVVGLGSVLIGLATPSIVTFFGERQSRRPLQLEARNDDSEDEPDADDAAPSSWGDTRVEWVRRRQTIEEAGARLPTWPRRRTT